MNKSAAELGARLAPLIGGMLSVIADVVSAWADGVTGGEGGLRVPCGLGIAAHADDSGNSLRVSRGASGGPGNDEDGGATDPKDERKDDRGRGCGRCGR